MIQIVCWGNGAILTPRQSGAGQYCLYLALRTQIVVDQGRSSSLASYRCLQELLNPHVMGPRCLKLLPVPVYHWCKVITDPCAYVFFAIFTGYLLVNLSIFRLDWDLAQRVSCLGVKGTCVKDQFLVERCCRILLPSDANLVSPWCALLCSWLATDCRWHVPH